MLEYVLCEIAITICINYVMLILYYEYVIVISVDMDVKNIVNILY